MILFSATAYAEDTTGTISNEVLPDFTEESVPVLNQTIRKLQSDIKTVQAAIPTTSIPTPATQSQMEAATATTVYADPANVKYAPSAAKAWCLFDGTAVGTNAPTAGYNVTSVTRNAAGDYRINLTTAFSTANYCPVGMTLDDGAMGPRVINIKSMAATSLSIRLRDASGGDQDVTKICVNFFGDQ